MPFWDYLHIGNGRIKPKLRAALESEGLELIEEGLPGRVRYDHFKAPGRRFNGKVTAERVGLAISRERLAIYCRSGSAKLMDTRFDEPRFQQLDISVDDGDQLTITIDFDKLDVENVSGVMRISATTPNAPAIAQRINERLGR